MSTLVKKPRLSKVSKAIGVTPLADLAHAKLSASGSKKWIMCTRSAALEALLPNEESAFASEGTFGHSLFEHHLLCYLGRKTEVAIINDLPGFDKYWSQELADSVEAAVEQAIEHIKQAYLDCKDPVILLEQRLDFSPWVPEGFGTGDLLIITDAYTKVLDLKMGKGVFVEAEDNTQFRLYMLGAFHTYGHLYDTPKLIGGVLQPRLNNYQTEEISLEDLLIWADTVVVPAAKAAWAGEGEFVPGEHCSSGFCRARATCAARAQSNLAIAQADFALTEPELMSSEQIAKVLTHGPAAIKWLNDVASHALTQATTKGAVYPGFKTVEGRSNRVISNPDAAAQALIAAGVPEEIIFERSMLGLTALEKAVGKKVLSEALADLITKPPGKPVLVPVSDKREAINSTASAVADFS